MIKQFYVVYCMPIYINSVASFECISIPNKILAHTFHLGGSSRMITSEQELEDFSQVSLRQKQLPRAYARAPM